MILVIDASIAVKWYVNEPGSNVAHELLADEDTLLAPAHALAGIGHVLVRRLTDRLLTREQIDAAMLGLRQTLAPVALSELLDVALEVALTTSASFYDALYIAAAIRCEGLMVTADHKLIRLLANTRWSEKVIPLEAFSTLESRS